MPTDRTDRDLRAGLAEGWRATRPYLLSHHVPADHDRCYALAVGDRRVRLCARCAGIYPGIVAGIVAFALGAPHTLAALGAPAAPDAVALALVAVLPAPALLDWTATAFTDRAGLNPVRTATGALLGAGYGLGLGRLFVAGDVRVLAVGLAYGLLAVALLAARDGS
ncbi:MAG: DUF2085 domain-containing protein [Halobacteriaceae archaeon]